MTWSKSAASAFGALLVSVVSTRAAEPSTEGASASPPDKSSYNLFHPTPRQFMRELITDRPDKTESPYTLDAGHFQIEADVLNYTYDRHNPARTDTRVETVALAPLNLKVGLCNRVDFQLMLQTYTAVRTHDRANGAVQKNRGFGDVIPRVKINLWGNDGGPTAFGILPYAKLPTNQDRLGNHSVEGGVIFPLAVELPRGWGMGMMTQYEFDRNASGSHYHTEFINSLTFGHDIVGKLGGYAEFFSSVSTERGSQWVGTVDLGLTYSLTKDIQLDAGVNLGVTRSADDLNPFIGISWRF